ncbi:DUF2264 domain-containing protein [Embleya sp. AB8]|uniref:DUF2264 domain-containing protein n=1 Tax=Embleya sp. AB8 TaxID=3156304 RepID=UPI003C7618BE
MHNRRRLAPPSYLPAEDRASAPVTGWTREHWIATADRLLIGLQPHTSPLGARICPPGRGSWSGSATDGLEGFARAFLLAAFRLAAADPTNPSPGKGRSTLPEAPGTDPARLAERFARGLLAGTDRGGPEAWPEITDGSQEMVEAANLTIALHECRPWVWDRIGADGRERVIGWLGGIVGRRPRDNNHVLFQVVAEEFLASVGAGHDRAEIDAGLDRVDAWYTGDGWYTDGPQLRLDHRVGDRVEFAADPAAGYDAGRRFDHYNAWGLHLYPLLWARIAGAAGQERARVYRARLHTFLGQYVHLFGRDGAPLHQGRSLSYRFACLAPYWLGALDDATPLRPGQTRRLASGVLAHFAGRGVPDAAGLLPLGWYRRFEPGTQIYSSPGSPYLAAQGFLGLLLPAQHAVWSTPEERLPDEGTDGVTALPAPGWLVHRTGSDGVVRVLNHGSCYLAAPPGRERDDPHYAKFAYATCVAPQTGPQAAALRLDNHLALLTPDGEPTRRERIHPLGLTDRWAASWHRPLPPEGAAAGAAAGMADPGLAPVVSVSVLYGAWEVRTHGVYLPAGWGVREGGYAPAADGPGNPVTGEVTPRPAAIVRTGAGPTCVVLGLYGWTEADVRFTSGANAFGRHSAVPLLRRPATDPVPGAGAGNRPAAVFTVLVSAVFLAGGPVDAHAEQAAMGVTVRVEGSDVLLGGVGLPDRVVRLVLPWREPHIPAGNG